MKQALFYETVDDKNVKCVLCPHCCIISPGKSGICGVRKNIDKKLIATTYGLASAVAVDPIEKKPLYHFYPSEQALSFGTIGCNFKCPYCQNWHISQNLEAMTEYISPQQAVRIALEKNIRILSYTYSEPLIWYEWVRDTSQLAVKHGLKNTLVTNGYINKEPLEELVPFIHAANIDVKAFNDKFYNKLCGGKLEPVKRNVEFLFDKIHIELTMLVIPGWNDKEEEIRSFARWVASLSRDIPVHFSRYFPQHNFKVPATPVETLEQCYKIAREDLHYVFIGNARIEGTDDTFCPHCRNLLLKRSGYFVQSVGLNRDRCAKCKNKVSIITG
ncbi:MAG: AmmeMemoRadiSam system radical SAM enzyme [Spirochaetes bacterium]|nr:AmmeMemoRadiSam system radical SAM enzyme [Spirochaetota bacterium]